MADQQPPQPRPWLDYATPGIDPKPPAGGMPYAGQVAIGFGMVWLWLAVAGTAVFLFPSAELAAAIFVVMVIALITLGIMVDRRWRWEGFPIGIFLGVCTLPCIGIIFAIISPI